MLKSFVAKNKTMVALGLVGVVGLSTIATTKALANSNDTADFEVTEETYEDFIDAGGFVLVEDENIFSEDFEVTSESYQEFIESGGVITLDDSSLSIEDLFYN